MIRKFFKWLLGLFVRKPRKKRRGYFISEFVYRTRPINQDDRIILFKRIP